MKPVTFSPIGVIHTPFSEPGSTPIQARHSAQAAGEVHIFDEFSDGLKDLDGFSHITLIYHFHLSMGFELEVIPSLETERRGLFSTRSPRRPNSIGVSVVRLKKIEGCRLYIENVDMVDGTPLLDIKPFIPRLVDAGECRVGWLEGRVDDAEDTSADQ